EDQRQHHTQQGEAERGGQHQACHAFSCSNISIKGCSSLVLIMFTHQLASCRSKTCRARSLVPGMISTHTVPSVELMMQASTARQWRSNRSSGIRMNCVFSSLARNRTSVQTLKHERSISISEEMVSLITVSGRDARTGVGGSGATSRGMAMAITAASSRWAGCRV